MRSCTLCSRARSGLMRTPLAGSWQAAAAAGACVAGDLVHVGLEMKAQLEDEHLRVTRIAERQDTQNRRGRVVTVVDRSSDPRVRPRSPPQ
eukprot:2657944-Prymnesium_polylepis.1